MSMVKIRQGVERAVVQACLDELFRAGFKPVGIDGGDGPLESKKGFTPEEAMKEIFDFDEARVHFRHPKLPQRRPWVKFVFGNEGYDTISDFSIPDDQPEFGSAVERVMSRIEKSGFDIKLKR